MRNLTLFSTCYTSLHVCVALAIRRLVHDPRYVPRLVLAATHPERGSLRSSPQPVFLVSSCLLLAMLFLPAVGPLYPLWLLFLTSCRFALSFLLSVHRFRGHFVDVHVLVHLLVLVSQLLRTAAVRPLRLLQRDIAFSSSSATAWLRAFGLNELLARSRADPRVLRTLLHVLRVVLVVSQHHSLSPARDARAEVAVSRARVLWLVTLTSP